LLAEEKFMTLMKYSAYFLGQSRKSATIMRQDRRTMKRISKTHLPSRKREMAAGSWAKNAKIASARMANKIKARAELNLPFNGLQGPAS